MIARFSKCGLLAVLMMLIGPSVVLGQNPPATPPTAPPSLAPVVTPANPTAAQAAAAALGTSVSNEQISDAIKRSGLSEAQVRQRLQSGGYDPSLADPFFKGGGVAPSSEAGSDFARALQNLGLLSPAQSETKDSLPKTPAERMRVRAGGVFGKDIFARSATSFDPITSGPVDPSYRLGVGDAMQLIVTGQVELAYQLEIRRDGSVVIPEVGQVSLAGLTLDAARTLLSVRMGQSYSLLRTGEARLDLSLSKIRSNSVFVIGEVEQPGAIQVNALSTVFHAIARAGGPTERGSFREIEVRRGNRVIQRLDLYDYLLQGDAKGDIRLEQGDVIFVPLNKRVVATFGAVRRPRIFELRANEGFNDLLRFAGGLLPTASTERVQIDRLVSAAERKPGFERVRVDVSLKGNPDSLAGVRLQDGDIVQVFSVSELRRNVVTVAGAVFQPGEYELKKGGTLATILSDAQGLLPSALSTVVKVVRQIPSTGRSELFSLDLTQASGQTFAIQEFDEITVLDGRTASPSASVSVSGAVANPATRPFVENETLRDAIERSGGFTEDAQSIEVSRRRIGQNYSDTTSIVFSFDISPTMWANPSLGKFVLARDDRVFVYRSAGFRNQRTVVVMGEFQRTGVFAVSENQDRLRDVVKRAGDVLPGAYAESFRLIRNGFAVGIDFKKAMTGDPAHNLQLLNGDTLTIRRDPQTVLVTGGVNRPSLIKFTPGRTVSEYIALAGGPSERGESDKAIVEYPSGFSKRVEKVAFVFRSEPSVVSGSVITVPVRPEDKGGLSEGLNRTLSVFSTVTSLIITIVALKKL